MSNIEQYLADILAARYGEEVRQSIHDAIQQCYKDGRAGAIDLEAREDIAAETTAREALDTRVNGIDTRVETLENDTTTAEEVTYDDTSTQLGATNVQGAIGALNNNLANKLDVVTHSGTFTGNINDIHDCWDTKFIYESSATGTLPTDTFLLITIRSVQIAIPLSSTVALYRRIRSNGVWSNWLTVNHD